MLTAYSAVHIAALVFPNLLLHGAAKADHDVPSQAY